MSENNSNQDAPEKEPDVAENKSAPQTIQDLLVQPADSDDIQVQINEQPIHQENMVNPMFANVAQVAQISIQDNEIHKKLMRRIKMEDDAHRCCCGLLDKRDNLCVHFIKLIFALIIFPFIFACKSGELFLDVCLDPCCIKLDDCFGKIGTKLAQCINYITHKVEKCCKGCWKCYKSCCNKVCRPVAYTCDVFCIGLDKVLTCIGTTSLKCLKQTAKTLKPCTDAITACLRAVFNKISKYVSCICSRVKVVCDAVMDIVEKIGNIVMKVAISIKNHVVTPMIKFLKSVGRSIMKYMIYPIVKLVLKIWAFVKLRIIKPTYAAMSRCVKAKRFALKEDTTIDEESQEPINNEQV